MAEINILEHNRGTHNTHRYCLYYMQDSISDDTTGILKLLIKLIECNGI